MLGLVNLYFLNNNVLLAKNNIKVPNLVIKNQIQTEQDNSTWSIDIFLSKKFVYLAAGSNTHQITLWDLSELF